MSPMCMVVRQLLFSIRDGSRRRRIEAKVTHRALNRGLAKVSHSLRPLMGGGSPKAVGTA
jgi:hypothetical protein